MRTLERLQKILSRAGVCSRRTAEEYLSAGRVTVGGRVASVGDKASFEADEIAVDGNPLRPAGVHICILLHKPRGVVTTLSDERGRPTVAGLAEGCGARVWPVGRLDYDSEGLLLMTNDGALTHRLTHPSHEVEKEYLVHVSGKIADALPILRGRMELDGVPLRPARVESVSGDVLRMVIHEGKNRQVRRMCTFAGLVVRRLIRVRVGGLTLGDLPSGSWRHLTPEELSQL